MKIVILATLLCATAMAEPRRSRTAAEVVRTDILRADHSASRRKARRTRSRSRPMDGDGDGGLLEQRQKPLNTRRLFF
jgi:hypothetical protein